MKFCFYYVASVACFAIAGLIGYHAMGKVTLATEGGIGRQAVTQLIARLDRLEVKLDQARAIQFQQTTVNPTRYLMEVKRDDARTTPPASAKAIADANALYPSHIGSRNADFGATD